MSLNGDLLESLAILDMETSVKDYEATRDTYGEDSGEVRAERERLQHIDDVDAEVRDREIAEILENQRKVDDRRL